MTPTRRQLLSWLAAVPAVALAGPRPAAALQATPPAEATLQTLVAGNTAFAFALYSQLRTGNLLMSPYSVSQALAMTAAGARGETAAQMAAVLSLPLDAPGLHDTFGRLNADLVARGNAEADPDDYVNARTLRLANALWGEQGYPFSADFTAELERAYGAGLREADFRTDPEGAREEINGWVEEQTEDRIQDIVPPGSITELTRLVLANAIFFSGSWYHPFNADNTADDAFQLLDGSTVSVPFMYQQEDLPYARGDGYQVVELGYAGDMGGASGFALTVILPDEGQFEAVESGLGPDALDTALGMLTYEDVRLWLPRFRFEFGPASLVEPLQALGVTDAFDPDRADFSGMLEGPTSEPPLVIDEVLHKAFIGVDEEGTEAAAATIVMMAPGAAPDPPTPPPPIEMRLDRPFLFAIRDTETSTILFLGRVLDPSA